MADYRIFQGNTTKHINGDTGHAADADGWYYEPSDYAGDVLYSDCYPTEDEARAAADAEFGEYE